MFSTNSNPKPFHDAKLTLSSSQKLEFINTLETLVAAGVTLPEAFESLEQGSKGSFKHISSTLKSDLTQGIRLAESMKKFPRAFDPITVNLIRAAEASGTLDEIFHNITQNLKKNMAFQGKIRTALAYPIFVVITFSLLILVMLIFVLPRFSIIFRQSTVSVPITTKILLGLSDIVSQNTTLILIGLGITIVIAAFFTKKYFFEIRATIYKAPLLRRLAVKIDLTRFYHSAGVLLNSGIPLPETLQLCKDIIQTTPVKKIIETSYQSVVSGQKLSTGIQDSGTQLPPLTIRIIGVGEKSGTLEKSFFELADYYENQVEEELRVVTALIEPILLVIIGGIMALVIFSVMNPIYQLINTITIQ